MVKLFVALLAVAVISPKDEVRIPVKFFRPSKIIREMKLMFGSNGGIEADDLAGEFVAFGTEEEIAEIRRAIALFDVKPQTLRVTWTYTHSIDKTEIDGNVVIRNGYDFAYMDPQMGATVSIFPRMTEKGTIRSKLKFEFQEAEFQKVYEFKRGEQAVIQIPELTPMNDRARKLLELNDKRTWPRLTFKFTVEPRQ